MVKAEARVAAGWEQVKQQVPPWAMVEWVLGQVGAAALGGGGEAVSALLDADVEELLGRQWREWVESRQFTEAGKVVCRRCGRHARETSGATGIGRGVW